MQNSEYMYADEVEREYPVAACTLRYWASIGTGPKSFKVGKRRVWRRSEVARWFAEKEAEGATAYA
jgi:prophage regulatory protein